MLKAKDIMTTEVITVTPETTVEELCRLFIEKNISGAPVVDDNKTLIGMVTESDLISQNKRFHIPTLVRLFDAFIPLQKPSEVEAEIRRMSAYRASEICTKEVVSVTAESTLQDIATIMSEKGIHHLPVLEAGRLIGIIGKMDVVRGSLGETRKHGS